MKERMCVTASMDPPHRLPLTLQPGVRHVSNAETENMATPVWPQDYPPFQDMDQSGSYFLSNQVHPDMRRIDTQWLSTPSQSQWSPELLSLSYPNNPWPSQGSRRRSSSSSGIPTSSNWYPSLISPEEQYMPSFMHGSPRRQPRSSSQPSRQSGRPRDIERPPFPRQITEASPIQQRMWSESAFRGSADYQLFVEATFGISPEHARHSSSTSTEYFEQTPPTRDFDGETIRSVTAFRQMAQLPMTPDETMALRAVSYSPPGRYHDADALLESSEYARSRRSLDITPNAGYEELPSYAQSQAEMQQRVRREAVIRAEELQRQWRECRY